MHKSIQDHINHLVFHQCVRQLDAKTNKELIQLASPLITTLEQLITDKLSDTGKYHGLAGTFGGLSNGGNHRFTVIFGDQRFLIDYAMGTDGLMRLSLFDLDDGDVFGHQHFGFLLGFAIDGTTDLCWCKNDGSSVGNSEQVSEIFLEKMSEIASKRLVNPEYSKRR